MKLFSLFLLVLVMMNDHGMAQSDLLISVARLKIIRQILPYSRLL